MTIMKTTPSPVAPAQARFLTGDTVFRRWHDDVQNGTGPVLYQHALPYPEIGPGLVTIIGGAPGGGKTALVTMMAIEMLRYQPNLRLLMANCEMAPDALLNRQLARLSGVDAEIVRHRRFDPVHEKPLAVGLATLASVTDRLAFMEAPYDIRNIAASADAFAADVVIVDYIQRFTVPTEDVEARHRVNRTMDYLRQFATAGLAVIVVSAVGRTRDRAGRSSYAADGLSLASFRESSELEFGGDDALILAPLDERKPDLLRLAHLKSRHGQAVTQDLHFNRSVQSFTLLGEAASATSVTSSSGSSAVGGGRAHPSVTTELRRLWESTHVADDDETPSAASGAVSDGR